MGRWTQYDEDSYRLPEGFRRIGYDADTQCYTFEGDETTWVGAPRENYGVMTPVSSHSLPRRSVSVTTEPRSTTRYASKTLPAISTKSTALASNSSPSAQQVFCPEDLYNSPLLENSSPVPQPSPLPLPSPKPSRKIISQFVNAVRRTTLPKMQGVVHSVRRSLTLVRKNNHVDVGPKSEVDEGHESKAGGQELQAGDLKNGEEPELNAGEGKEPRGEGPITSEGQEPLTKMSRRAVDKNGDEN